MVVDALRRAPAFSTLSDASLAQLQTAVEAQSLKPGALLFSEGDQAGAVYLLQMIWSNDHEGHGGTSPRYLG